MRHPATAVDFEWDQGNVDKLAERGILVHEVEGVWGTSPATAGTGRRAARHG